MKFFAIKLSHGERINWDKITHVRRTGINADTPAGEKILKHIRLHEKNGYSQISDFENRFPYVRRHETEQKAMRTDLRHMANDRKSGANPENKGLIEIGYFVAE